MPGSRLFATFWEWQVRSEPPTVRAIRAAIAGGARGRVLEIGCGPGSNFPYYTDATTSITAIDPNPHMLERAHKRAVELGRAIEIRQASAEGLPFDDASFDTVVSTFNMCSVDNVATSLAGIKRVLSPEGEYRFADHVRYDSSAGGRWQDVVTPVWSRIGDGCHPNRDIATAIRDAGLEFVELDHGNPVPAFQTLVSLFIVKPHIHGVARIGEAPANTAT